MRMITPKIWLHLGTKVLNLTLWLESVYLREVVVNPYKIVVILKD
jgi:hypothetical protein